MKSMQEETIPEILTQKVGITHICFNPVGCDTREPRSRGSRVHDKRFRPFQISLLVLMNHMNLEPLVDVEEVHVDVVERLIVLPQSLNENGLGVEKLPRYMTRHTLQG